MFIPKIRTKVEKKLLGTLVDTKSKRAYNGKYVKDYRGNYYKGETINRNSEKLDFIPDQNAIDKEVGLKHTYVKPTPNDYKNGFFIRYFVKDSRVGKVYEITKQEYTVLVKQKKPYRRTAKMEWLLKGPAESQTINNYVYPGTSAKNENSTKKIERILSGIQEQILKNPAEFVI